MAPTLLIADDDATIRTVLGRALTRAGFKVRTTAHASTLWHWAEQGEGDLVISDVMMPDGDGLELVPNLRRIRPELKVIIISAQNALTTSIKAQDAGVFAYLPKPFDLKELTNQVNAALQQKAPLSPEAQRDPLAKRGKDEDIPLLVSKSKLMKSLLRLMGRVTQVETPVLFMGESGAGKSQAIKAFVQASQLSNNEKNRFSASDFDALVAYLEVRIRTPQSPLAVLQVDRVETLNPAQQVKLISLLDAANEAETFKTFRLLLTANPSLYSLVDQGAFLRDLFDRLTKTKLFVPPLRDRRDDLPDLIEHFQRALGTELIFPPDTMTRLQSLAWPGNVHQLENLIWRLSLEKQQGTIHVEDLDQVLEDQHAKDFRFAPLQNGALDQDLGKLLDVWLNQTLNGTNFESWKGELHTRVLSQLEKPLIEMVLVESGNNQLKAADYLGLNRNTLRKKIQELGIHVGKKGKAKSS